MDRLVAARDALAQRLHQVGIAAGDELVDHLDHGDPRAERVVDRRHLQADDPAADHQQPLGDVVQRQRAGRVHHARVVGQPRDPRRLGAGGDDAASRTRSSRSRPASPPRARAGEVKRPVPRTTSHLALLGQAGEAAGQARPPRPSVAAAQRVEVDLRLAEGDAELARPRAASASTRAACSSALEGMQPTLRQTPPSREWRSTRITLQAEVGRAEGGRVAAGPPAEDDEVGAVALAHSSMRRGSRRAAAARCVVKRAAAAPSTTRWS